MKPYIQARKIGAPTILSKPYKLASYDSVPASHLKKSIKEFGSSSKTIPMENAFRQSEELFRQTVTAIPIGILLVDHAGDIILVNPTLLGMFGYFEAELIGESVEKLVPDRHRSGHATFRARYIATPSARPMGAGRELMARPKDGTEFPVEIGLAPITFRQQPMVLCTIVDITARKKVERQAQEFTVELERKVMERSLELLESQERLRKLASDLNLTEQRERQHLAGELHDYLAQLLVLCQMNLGQTIQMDHLEEVIALNQQTQEILGEALTYTRTLVSQLYPPVLKEFGLAMALQGLADQMKEQGLQVTLNIESEPFALPEDQAILLYQSVRELLMNVRKHANTKKASVSVRQFDHHLVIIIQDNGKGFDTEAALHPSAGVSTFGLFSIRERMRSLGGNFEIMSEIGKGTIAKLVLSPSSLSFLSSSIPADIPSTKDFPKSPGPPISSSRAAKIRILLVDDHAMVRTGLRSVLEHYPNFEIIGEAANGEEAVTLAHELMPEVILMDISMPKMDGIQATRKITNELPVIIIIGMSVHGAAQVRTEMMNAGASAFISKESAVTELFRVIQETVLERNHAKRS